MKCCQPSRLPARPANLQALGRVLCKLGRPCRSARPIFSRSSRHEPKLQRQAQDFAAALKADGAEAFEPLNFAETEKPIAAQSASERGGRTAGQVCPSGGLHAAWVSGRYPDLAVPVHAPAELASAVGHLGIPGLGD